MESAIASFIQGYTNAGSLRKFFESEELQIIGALGDACSANPWENHGCTKKKAAELLRRLFDLLAMQSAVRSAVGLNYLALANLAFS